MDADEWDDDAIIENLIAQQRRELEVCHDSTFLTLTLEPEHE